MASTLPKILGIPLILLAACGPGTESPEPTTTPGSSATPTETAAAQTATPTAAAQTPTAPTATATEEGDTPTPAAFGEVQASTQERDTNPDVSSDQMNSLVGGNTAFALDLYQQIRTADGNLFYSPHSMSQAVAMTWAGAKGTTDTQMAETMHFDLPQAELHPAMNALDLALASRADVAPESDVRPFQLNVVNAAWGQTGYTFLDPYLDTLAIDYGAAMRLVNYSSDTEGARQTINGWVASETEDRIDELIPAGVLTVDTRLVLVNAIYFAATWKWPFSEDVTAPGTFTTLAGPEVTADMMQQTIDGGGVQYSDGEGLLALEMPYDGDQLSMVLIAPETGTFDTFEAGITPASLQGIIDGMAPGHIRITMPKFEFDYDLPLADHLKAMGMTDAFDAGLCDLSGMDGTDDLYVQDVLHKAFVAVDEFGTEAAAATAVVVGIESAPQPVVFDRPFVFLIRDIPTGAVLFMGRVVDPSI